MDGMVRTMELPTYVENSDLCLLQDDLSELVTCLENFGLPTPNMVYKMKCLTHLNKQQRSKNITCLNSQQEMAHTMILASFLGDGNGPGMFFINAPGGYGKIFLMETILSSMCSAGKIALVVASSGIAVELLEGGRTAHSHFKIPILISDESMCAISLQSTHAQLMRLACLICWDAILMSNKQHIECIDRSLRDTPKVDKPFGGITVVFGGDLHQILPVVHHGDHLQIVKACVKSSGLWIHVHEIKLTQNMRVDPAEFEFAEYLLHIGNGTEKLYEEIGNQVIKVWPEYLVNTLEELVQKIFPDIQNGYEDKYYVAHHAMLTPKNKNVDRINAEVMHMFPGEVKSINLLTLLLKMIWCKHILQSFLIH